MTSFSDIWKNGRLDLGRHAIAMGNSLMVINSAQMLDKLKLPLKLTTIISVVCLSGEITFETDSNRMTLTANTMLVLSPGHVIKSITASADFRGFSIVASMKVLSVALPYLSRVVVCFMHFSSNPVIALTREEAATQEHLHDLLQAKLSQPPTFYSELVIRHLSEGILYETLGLYASHLGEPSLVHHKRSEEIFYRFIRMVEEHFRTERSVSFYAKQVAVTPKHLSATVKECSGRTAGEWIDSYVVLEAKKLLSSSEKTVQQISAELNFPNQSFFGKYFKHHTGMSPRQFRTERTSI